MHRVIALIMLAELVSGATRQDVIQTCSEKGSTCIGYNADSDCSADVSKCMFAFASISKADDDKYRVQLVGRGGGWVSLGFSDDESSIMKADNLGVVCVNAVNPAVQILQIQDIAPPPVGVAKKPIQFENSGLSDSISNEKLELHDGWMICEFTLSPKPRHATKVIDLKGKPYKLGLAANLVDGIHNADEEYANQPVYHGATRGCSDKKLDIFQKL